MSKVLIRGLNIAAQLNPSRKSIPTFTQLPELANHTIQNIGCGYLQSMYLLEDGQFLKAGYILDSLSSMRLIKWNRFSPALFKGIQKMFFLGSVLSFKGGDQNLTLLNKAEVLRGITFKKAVISHSSAYLLTTENEVFCIGENYFGQLGTTNSIASESSFNQIPNPNGEKIVDLACGFQHTVFLTESGLLYGCGKAESFQIQPETLQNNHRGVVTLDKIQQPELIWSKGKVKRVACGFKNTIFQTENNRLYALGDNKFGQCGIHYENSRQIFKPTEIYFPQDQEILDIVCGYRHTLILTTNRVYFSGSVENNQNPFANFMENIGSFSPMSLPAKPIKIFAKFDRTAIITEDGRAFLFGGKDLRYCGGQSSQLQILSDFEFGKDSLIGLGFSHTILYV